MKFTIGDGVLRDISELPNYNVIVTIYYSTAEAANLPTTAAIGSVATNPSNKEVKMFDGSAWVTWKAGE